MSSHSYPPFDPTPSPPKQYPAAHSMSSAFSASANPNEDWTKISDLAERRRIQNRIAQRNYRKKLKKRLEDLERRAGSSSASPEQQPAELAITDRSYQRSRASSSLEVSSSRSSSQKLQRHASPDILSQQYLLPSDDRAMFSQQSTRQLSTSPPPFSYNAIPFHDNSQMSYAQQPSYCMPASQPLYGQFVPQGQQMYPASMPAYPNGPVKTEQFGDDEMSPFSMSYASIANLDVSTAQSYSDVSSYTPSLLDSLDFGQPDSPPESLLCPRTPTSLSQTPPLYL